MENIILTNLKNGKYNFTFHTKQNKRSYCVEFVTRHSSQMFDVKWRHCITSKTKENIKLFGQVKLFGIKHMT